MDVTALGLPRTNFFEIPIFQLYMNDLTKQLAELCKVVHYADDKLLFCDDNDIKNALELLQKFVRNCLCTSQNIFENSTQTKLI